MQNAGVSAISRLVEPFFVNNVLAVSAMSPIALKIAALLPPASLQQNACGLISYQAGGNQRQYQIPAKVDYILSTRHTMFVRYILSNNYTPMFYDPKNPLFTGSTTGQSNNIQSTAIGETYVISPMFVASSHLGEPQSESSLHSHVRDSRFLWDSSYHHHSQSDEHGYHERPHSRRGNQQPRVL
jgi:hypothetical protein